MQQVVAFRARFMIYRSNLQKGVCFISNIHASSRVIWRNRFWKWILTSSTSHIDSLSEDVKVFICFYTHAFFVYVYRFAALDANDSLIDNHCCLFQTRWILVHFNLLLNSWSIVPFWFCFALPYNVNVMLLFIKTWSLFLKGRRNVFSELTQILKLISITSHCLNLIRHLILCQTSTNVSSVINLIDQ